MTQFSFSLVRSSCRQHSQAGPPFRYRCVRNVIYVLLCVFLINTTCLGARPTDLMSQALKKRVAGDLQGAVSLLRDALDQAESPLQRNLARSMLGDSLVESGQLASARDYYQQILQDSPRRDETAEALYRIAYTWFLEKHTGKMRPLCNQIVREYPKSPFEALARNLLDASMPGTTGSNLETPKQAPVAAARDATKPGKPKGDMASVAGAAAKPRSTASQPSSSAAKRPAIEPTITTSATQQKPQTQIGPTPTRTVRNLPTPTHVTTVIPSLASPQELNRLLNIGVVSSIERADLASRILQRQNRLSDRPDDPHADQTLFYLASETARFGELLESCKLYDRLLTQFPSSAHVEDAYFEAIRLRVILRAYKPVQEWAEVFNETFPSSVYKNRVSILTAHAQHQMAAQQRKARPAPVQRQTMQQQTTQQQTAPQRPATAAGTSGKAGNSGQDVTRLPRYKQAKRRATEEKYALALLDFQELTAQYPREEVLWWELALVQVQQEQYDDAEDSLSRLLILNPGHEEGRSLLGYVQYRTQKYQEAAQQYQTSAESSRQSGKGINFYDSAQAAERLRRTTRPDNTSSGPK